MQEESFSGPLALLIGENVVARAIGFREKTRRGFEKFNADFKGWCESDGEEKGK